MEKLGGGIKRTSEGLNFTDKATTMQIGAENYAAYEFASSAFDKAVNFDLDLIDNPITQAVFSIVNEYINIIPEWVIEECIASRALQINANIDLTWLLKASAMGVVKDVTQEELQSAAKLLGSPAQRIVGKKIGKRLAPAIASAIATQVTKNLMRNSPEATQLKRQLVRIRQIARKAKGGSAGVLFGLLKAQDILNKAAESSRRLQRSCPRVWNTLRYQLNGANMVYFLIESMVQEYVDRLALLESNPKEFAKVMAALIKDKQTKSIFFP